MKNIGLALGGGAVLGAAHVGVAQAISEFDIKVDAIAGTSIGAFVGAFYAFGMSWQEIKKVTSELKWIDIAEISLSRYGLLSNEKMGDLVIKHLGDKNIEEAEITLSIVATDIVNGDKTVLTEGSLAEAVMASTCIPGIFKPVEIANQTLVDGGVVENVPIRTVKEMGAEYIVGVDLNAKHTYEKPGNILDVLLNSFHFMMQHANQLQTDEADLMIAPDLSGFNRSDTDQVDELMKVGYEDSMKCLKKMDQ